MQNSQTSNRTRRISLFPDTWFRGLLALLVVMSLASAPAAAQDLINGGALSGEIAPAQDVDLYKFSANAGETVTIRVAEDNDTPMSLQAEILSPFGALVVSETGSFVAAIQFVAATKGTYTLRVSDSNKFGFGTSKYMVHFALAPGANEHGLLINGGQVTESISVGDIDSFTFQVNANQTVFLRVADSGFASLAPRIAVYAPFGQLVDSETAGSVAAVEFTATATGTYTLVVTDGTLQEEGFGTYVVHFAKSQGANEHGALSNVGSTSETIDRGDIDSFTFEAQVFETIILRLVDPVSGTPW